MALRNHLLVILAVCCLKIVHGYPDWIPADESGNKCSDEVRNYCEDCATAAFCNADDSISATACDDGNACYTNGQVTGCFDISNVPECQCPTEGAVQIPDPYDTQKFILCLNGVGTVEKCADETHYNPVTEKCDLDSPPTSVPTVTPFETCPTTPGSLDVLAVTCTSYRICHSDGATGAVAECDNGYLFDTSLNECVKYEPFSCPSEDEAKYYADNHDCNMYYLCYQGEIAGQSFTCPVDQVYDNEAQSCTEDTDKCEAVVDCGICPDDQTAFAIDCTRYYQCTENPDYDPEGSDYSTNLQYIPVVQECDSGFYFYPDTGECLSSVPGCPATS